MKKLGITVEDEMYKDPDFIKKKSSCSCDVSDINAIIYCGINSRFWMLRKHCNSLNPDELEDLPFYSWECLSLELAGRNIDLVIKDDK